MKVRHIIDSPRFDKARFLSFWKSEIPDHESAISVEIAGRRIDVYCGDPEFAEYISLCFFPATQKKADAQIHVIRWRNDLRLPVECNIDDRNESYQFDDGNDSFFMRPGMGYFQSYCASERTGICCFRASYMAKLVLVLYWWARSNDMTLAHCAAVGSNGKGVLLCGRSGQGKSTTALACLESGMDFVSDDCMILSYENGALVAYPLYTSLRVSEATLSAYPALRENAFSSRFSPPKEIDDKTEILLSERYRTQIMPLTIRAILLPQVDLGRRKPMLEMWMPAAVKVPLIYSTLAQFYDDGNARMAQRMLKMLSGLSCFKLYLSGKYADNTREIFTLLKGL